MRTKNPYLRALFFSFLLVATIFPFSAKAAVFNVTTAEELRLALETASMNGEDD